MDRSGNHLDLMGFGREHHTVVGLGYPFDVRVIGILQRRQSRGNMTDLAGLLFSKTLHVLRGIFVLALVLPCQPQLGTANVAAEVALQVKRDLLGHTGQFQPAGHFAGLGVIEFTLQ